MSVSPGATHVLRSRPTADLHAAPDGRAERVSQCLFGERVTVLDERGDWYRMRKARDGYEGWLRGGVLDEAGALPAATHRVGVSATLLFESPDIKSPVPLRLPLGAELALADAVDGTPFARVSRGADRADAYVWNDHCRPVGRPLEGSPIALAQRLFAGTPYLWGGCTPDGADCSGLVQSVAFALGIALPRDSGDQERFLKHEVDPVERGASDLVFWPGHVGLLVDADTLFHATAHCLASVAEPLADVVDRAGGPSSVRRLAV